MAIGLVSFCYAEATTMDPTDEFVALLTNPPVRK